jgi:hypothetical protein
MSRLCKALGPLAVVIANSRQLTGDFNSHMRNKLLALVEESFWAGNHSDEGPLKHLITDELTTFERKGVDAEAGRSFIRLVLVTNQVWAAPASSDERRFAFLSVSDAGKRRNFEEGGTVKAGQSLYSLDPAPFQATVTRAEADVAAAQRRAYEGVARISWADHYYRRDIGHRAIGRR